MATPMPLETFPRADVAAALSFVAAQTPRPVVHIATSPDEDARREARFENHVVTIRDMRRADEEPRLDVQGFELRLAPTRFDGYFDPESVRVRYYPEIAALVKSHTGADRVVVFDHNVRVGDPRARAEQSVRGPVRTVHNDYTERSGPRRLADLLGDEASEKYARFAMINAWRPIHGPVLSSPLAVCDARSMPANQLIASDLVYRDRVGEIYHAVHHPDQSWYYAPRMDRDEVLLIKCYDSLTDGRARFSAHSAFDDPNTPPGAPARESIEVRTIALFDR